MALGLLFSARDAGAVAERARDLTWDALCEFADRVNGSRRGADLEVQACQKRQWLITVVEGIWVGNKRTDVFEPVRRRSVFSDHWIGLQSVEVAAAKIGDFLDRRPDLGEADGGRGGRTGDES